MTEVNCTNILNTIACLDPAVNEYEVLLNNDITVRPDGSGNDSYAGCAAACSAA